MVQYECIVVIIFLFKIEKKRLIVMSEKLQHRIYINNDEIVDLKYLLRDVVGFVI